GCLLLVRPFRTLCLFFFFSSRRRHTRSKRDWSSDVCSSDLTGLSWHRCLARHGRLLHHLRGTGLSRGGQVLRPPRVPRGRFRRRSEERRVGKGGRARQRPGDRTRERKKSTEAERDSWLCDEV